MALSTIGTNQIASEAVTVPKVADQVLSNRNFVINGDFQCWQRATAATAAGVGTYNTADRWRFYENSSGAFTSERSTDTPIGTGYSLKLQVTTADTSMASGDYAYFTQPIEAQNLQSLQYGTSSAKTLTLSFWVKSSKTGIYAITLVKPDNTLYNYAVEYTISNANTWEKKIITITPTAGSTSFITSAAGAIANDNGQGLWVVWMLASGSNLTGSTNNAWTSNALHYTTTNQVNWLDSTSNNFYLAQVQLEIGTSATPFEHEDFGTTLAKCQRYLYRLETEQSSGAFVSLTGWNTNDTYGPILYPVEMRAAPTLSIGAEAADFLILSAGTNPTPTELYSNGSSKRMMELRMSSTGNIVAGRAYWGRISDDTNGFIQWDAEL